MKFTTIPVVLSISITAYGKLVVRQSMPAKSVATVERTEAEEVQVGDEILFAHAGKQCSTKVTQLSGNVFNVTTAECAFKNEILIGDQGEKPLLSSLQKQEQVEIKKTSDAEKESSNGIEMQSHIPRSGETFFSGAFGVTTIKGTVKGPAGTVYETKVNSTAFEYSLDHGASNSLALKLFGTINSSKSDYTYGAGSTKNGISDSSKSSGWKEPEIAALWRVKGEAESKLKIDLLLGFRPKLQTAKFSSTADGNYGIGGAMADLGLNLHKEVEGIEFELKLLRTLQTVGKFEDAADSTKTAESEEHQSTQITGGIQGRLSNRLFLGGDLQFFGEDRYSTSYYSSGAKTSTLDNGATSAMSAEVYAKVKIDESSLIKLSAGNLFTYTQAVASGTTKLDVSYDSGTSLSLVWMQGF